MFTYSHPLARPCSAETSSLFVIQRIIRPRSPAVTVWSHSALSAFKENALFGCCSIYPSKKARTVAARASDVPSNFKIQLCELSLLQRLLFFFFFFSSSSSLRLFCPLLPAPTRLCLLPRHDEWIRVKKSGEKPERNCS